MSNLHENLPDNQLHPAKGFSDSNKGGVPWKNQAGEQKFTPLMQLPNAINVANSSTTPPTEDEGDVYLLNAAFGAFICNETAWQSGNTVRYFLNAAKDLSLVATGDWFTISGFTNAENNGTFKITAVNDGSDYVDIVNTAVSDSSKDESSMTCEMKVTDADWDGCQQGSWVRFNGTTWEEVVPIFGTICYLSEIAKHYSYTSDGWVSLNTTATTEKQCLIKVSQTGTGAPTIHSTGHNTISAITGTSRFAGGLYYIDFTGTPFTDSTKVVVLNGGVTSGNVAGAYQANNRIAINTVSDGVLNYTDILIKILP